MRLSLPVIHIDDSHIMCRVRFGLTGIYFDALEPSRPREESIQPLIVSVPPVLHNKHGDVGPKAMSGGETQQKVIIATEAPNENQDCTTENACDSSSSSSRDEGCRSTKSSKTIHASVGCKRVRNSISSSSSASTSSASPPPPSSDEVPIHDLANRKINLRAPRRLKLIGLRKPPKTHNNSPKRHASLSPEGLIKAPPRKRVRFAMDEHESIKPGHGVGSTSSSHSSDDSYTDPPLPTELCDPFRGYYRMQAVSNSRDTNGQRAGRWTQVGAEVATDMDDYGFLDSEDGSEVDVQALPVKRCSQRTMHANVGGPKSNQRHHQSNTAPIAWSKQSTRSTDESRVVAQVHQRNVDNGLQLNESHANQREPAVLPESREQLHYPKLRSGRDLPEPIFVVKPRFSLHAKGKGEPAGIFRGGEYSRDTSKNRQEGTKGPPSCLGVAKAPNQKRPLKYQPPSITDDLKIDVEFDVGLDRLVRDV